MKILFAIAAVAMTSLTGAIVHAAPAPAPGFPAERVSYADINMATEAGQKLFHTRVRAAAGHVCATGSSDLGAKMAEAGCRHAAIASAERALNARTATALASR